MVTLVQHAAEIRAFLESHFDTHGFISFRGHADGSLETFVLRGTQRTPDAARTARFVDIVMEYVTPYVTALYLNVYEDNMLLSSRADDCLNVIRVDKWLNF
jgi:hypothetical protein